MRNRFGSWLLAAFVGLAANMPADRSFAQSPTASSIDAQFSSDSLMHHEAYGIRIGLGERLSYSNLKPILNPFYEIPIPNFLASAELTLSYQSPQEIQFLHLPDKFHFDSYGFDFKMKSIFGAGSTHPFTSFGIEFEVLTNRVSLGIPLTAGALIPVNAGWQIECAAVVTPLLYLGQGFGAFYGVVVGFRIPGTRQ